MKLIFIGLLLAVACYGLENKYIPPIILETNLQSLEEDTLPPAHTLDEDGYRYRIARVLRRKRETSDSTTPATFDELYADSKIITKDLPDSNFLGPSPEEDPEESTKTTIIEDFQGPSPDQIARATRPENQILTSVLIPAPAILLQPFQQAFIETAVLGSDGYRYKTVYT